MRAALLPGKPRIAPAVPDMAAVASRLIHLTMGRTADYLFGAGDPMRAQDLLSHLFQLESNRFSFRFAEVAYCSEELSGLLISYPGPVMRTLDVPMAVQLMTRTGIQRFIEFLGRAWPLAGIREVEDDEYFIGHLAVLPDRQRRGIGSRLLETAERAAREQGFSKLSLTVGVENERAQALYMRTGFEAIETVQVTALRKRFGYPGFYRMLKLLK